jgi:ankyrin repeat protein
MPNLTNQDHSWTISRAARALFALEGENEIREFIANNQRIIDVTHPESGASLLHRVLNSSAGINLNIARILIENGADVHAQDINGDTPLHYYPSNVAGCELLIAHGADVNAENNNGRTPLHRAVEMQSIGTIRLLIENGANVHAQDINGDTPSSVAHSNTELFSLFPGQQNLETLDDQQNLEILGDNASDTSE